MHIYIGNASIVSALADIFGKLILFSFICAHKEWVFLVGGFCFFFTISRD